MVFTVAMWDLFIISVGQINTVTGIYVAVYTLQQECRTSEFVRGYKHVPACHG